MGIGGGHDPTLDICRMERVDANMLTTTAPMHLGGLLGTTYHWISMFVIAWITLRERV